MCLTMFIAALFVIARTWKQPKYLSTKEWIRKIWYIYTMEYYTAEKNNDILKFVGKWIDLENIILSVVTQIQKDKYNMYSLTHKWLLDIKQRKPAYNSQSQRTQTTKRTPRQTYMDLINMGSRKRQDLLSKLGAWGPWEKVEWEGKEREGSREKCIAQ